MNEQFLSSWQVVEPSAVGSEYFFALLISGVRWHDHVTPLLVDKLHWLRIPERIVLVNDAGLRSALYAILPVPTINNYLIDIGVKASKDL